jgi:predicted enzyme related to lactoylglutathione lyase
VYPKPDYQPATFTVLNFVVDDMSATIADLRAKGVTMEQYDNPEMPQDADGVMSGGGMRIAWFKDPAGNILSVIAEDRT